MLRFNTEAKAVAKLRHPNIVEVYDVSGPDDPELYLVVELVRGTTLRALLAKHGALPPEIAAAIAILLLDALAHAHASGVVHRDIKPENVLIERVTAGADDTPAPGPAGGDRVVVKLTDFGIAKLLDAQGVTSTGQVLGSPAHMAPEQIEGGEVDGRSDVFGMGVLFYECVVGHLPFEGQNPAQVLRRVLDGTYPEACRSQSARSSVRAGSKIVDRALAHAQQDRYADADAMKAALVAELDRLGFSEPTSASLGAWLGRSRGAYQRGPHAPDDRAPALPRRRRAQEGQGDRRGRRLQPRAGPRAGRPAAPAHRHRDEPRRGDAGAKASGAPRPGGRGPAAGVGVAVTMALVRLAHRVVTSQPVPIPAASASGTLPLPVGPSAAASAVAGNPGPTGVPSTTATAAPVRPGGHLPLARGPRDTSAKVTSRVVTLDLKPAMGVSVSVRAGRSANRGRRPFGRDPHARFGRPTRSS